MHANNNGQSAQSPRVLFRMKMWQICALPLSDNVWTVQILTFSIREIPCGAADIRHLQIHSPKWWKEKYFSSFQMNSDRQYLHVKCFKVYRLFSLVISSGFGKMVTKTNCMENGVKYEASSRFRKK